MLTSLTTLVFFLYGSLGFPNLPPLPPPGRPPALLQPAAPGLAPEYLGRRLVEVSQRLNPAASAAAGRDFVQIVPLSDPNLKAQINLLIKKYAKRHGIDEKLVRAVLQKESGGNPTAVSPKGAMGLMQLMPETAQSLGVEDPFNPEQNVAAGVKFLKTCLNLFSQDVTLALAAYNAGPETVKRYGGVPPYPETQQYVAGILGCPVEDLVKKTKDAAEGKGPLDQTVSPRQAKSADRLPKPVWKLVHTDVTVPPVRWKVSPALTALNPLSLQNTAPPDAARPVKTSLPPGDGKAATNTGSLAIPRTLQNYGFR
jgi:hypothetical protein